MNEEDDEELMPKIPEEKISPVVIELDDDSSVNHSTS